MSALTERLSNSVSIVRKDGYLNESLGKISYLLAGVLQLLLKKVSDWHSNRWIDDSLLTDINVINSHVTIRGIMIWGVEDTTEQCVDPFRFEAVLPNHGIGSAQFTFRFCDASISEISYEEFRFNRNYWDDTKERNWKYIISSNDV